MNTPLTLDQARELIYQHITALSSEEVDLQQAFGRISRSSHYAPYSLPDYSQSIYDGYAIASQPAFSSNGLLEYEVVGEIAAGDTTTTTITGGKAFRIMTGGMVPKGTFQVVPQEHCQSRESSILVAEKHITWRGANIRAKGSRLRKGTLLVQAGGSLTAQDLARLAQFGMGRLEVFKKVKVAFFCSGAELINHHSQKEAGKKFSSNRYLLAGLTQQCGGISHDGGIVEDDLAALQERLLQLEAEKPEIIVSTGGMGPGKYDLIREAFSQAGGKSVFTSLKMRPGKSVLFGTFADSLYFGLPGPPFGVLALFYALVLPAIMAKQGRQHWKPLLEKAIIAEDMHIIGRENLRLREGIVFTQKGKVKVRLCRPKEMANCLLHCQAGRTNYRRGALISVQPISGSCVC